MMGLIMLNLVLLGIEVTPSVASRRANRANRTGHVGDEGRTAGFARPKSGSEASSVFSKTM